MDKKSKETKTITFVKDAKSDELIKGAILLEHPDSRLDTALAKFHPMCDSSIPFRDLTDATTKRESIRKLIDKLDVSKSERYQRTVEDTYCNVYSFDFCYFSQVYLPTVWWTDESIAKLQNGEDVVPVFNETVLPIYSSAIHDWFGKWGPSFGWKKMTNLDEIQEKVNTEGGVGIILVNDKKIAEKRIEKTQPGIFSVDDLADVGVDDGTHVADYGKSSKFNGKIEYVTVERKK